MECRVEDILATYKASQSRGRVKLYFMQGTYEPHFVRNSIMFLPGLRGFQMCDVQQKIG